jgi:hypothetical protein
MTTTETTPEYKAPRRRSPAYPSISLAEAVVKAKQLLEATKGAECPSETAAQIIGYKNLTGPAGMALSAMKKYGLISGNGKVKTHPDFLKIAFDHRDKPALLREAANRPGVFKELSNRFDPDVTESVILAWLVVDKGFLEKPAKTVIENWRATCNFIRGLDSEPETEEAPTEPEAEIAPSGGTDADEEETVKKQNPYVATLSSTNLGRGHTVDVLSTRDPCDLTREEIAIVLERTRRDLEDAMRLAKPEAKS